MCASLTFAVLIALLACVSSAALQVKDANQLRNALVDSAVVDINLVSTVRVTKKDWLTGIRISRAIVLHGVPGVVLDLYEAEDGVLKVAAPGRLALRSLTLAVSSLPSSGAGSPPVPAFISEGGSITYDRVIFYARGPAVHQQQASNSSSRLDRQQHQSGRAGQPVQLADSSSAWRLQHWASGLQEVISCSAVADATSCFVASRKPGSVLAFDSASLRDALQDPAVHSITVLQDIQLHPQHCSCTSGEQLVVSRPLSLASCAGATVRFNNLQSCWLVASGALLQLQPGLQLSHSADTRSSRSSSSNTARNLLLPAVDVVGSGAVAMQGVEVQLTSAAAAPAAAAAWQAALQHIQQQGQLTYLVTGHDSVAVLDWRLPGVAGVQQQQAQRTAGAPLVMQASSEAPFATQQGVAVTRRLLLQRQAHWRNNQLQQQQQQQQQQQGLWRLQEPAAAVQRQLLQAPAGPANASAASPASAPSSSNRSSSNPIPADAPAPTNSSAVWGTGDNAALGAAYPKASCFADFPGFLASDIVGFVRLIKDPAITRIELTNDIVFTEDLFPPDHANNQSLGINVTHSVRLGCLACCCTHVLLRAVKLGWIFRPAACMQLDE
jgi:hypothetical protein